MMNGLFYYKLENISNSLMRTLLTFSEFHTLWFGRFTFYRIKQFVSTYMCHIKLYFVLRINFTVRFLMNLRYVSINLYVNKSIAVIWKFNLLICTLWTFCIWAWQSDYHLDFHNYLSKGSTLMPYIILSLIFTCPIDHNSLCISVRYLKLSAMQLMAFEA